MDFTLDSLLEQGETYEQSAVKRNRLASIAAQEVSRNGSVQSPYTKEISQAILSATGSSSDEEMLDCFSVDSFSDLISRVIYSLNLKPAPGDSQEEEQVMEDASDLTVKLITQAGIIDELSTRFNRVQQLVIQQTEEIEVSHAEIMRLKDQAQSEDEAGVSRSSNPQENNETRNQDTPAEEGEMIREVEEFPSVGNIQRSVAPKPGKLYTPQDHEDANDYRCGTDACCQEALWYVMKRNSHPADPPTVLGIGLQSLGEKSINRQNPYQHLLKAPYQMEAQSYRTQSIVPGLAKHAFNHQEHLSSVLSRQTHELLSTTTPDQYIRVLHKQLRSMLGTLHDCIDALAEETRSSERWKSRLEQYKKQVEKDQVSAKLDLRDMKIKHQGNIKREQRLQLLNIDLLPTVLLSKNEGKKVTEKKIRSRKQEPLKGEDEFEMPFLNAKSHSRPKYVAPIE